MKYMYNMKTLTDISYYHMVHCLWLIIVDILKFNFWFLIYFAVILSECFFYIIKYYLLCNKISCSRIHTSVYSGI